MAASEYDITLRQGSSDRLSVRWETEPYVYAQIASISRSAPVRIVTQTPHNLPDGWRVAVLDAKGLTALNARSNPTSKGDLRRVTVIDSVTVEFNDLSTAAAAPAHTANTGYLQWLTPHTLQGYTARMSVKDRVGGQVLLSLTTDNGGIELDDNDKTVVVVFNPAHTEGVAWRAGVYDLELVSPGGTVTPLLFGAFALTPEITTP